MNHQVILSKVRRRLELKLNCITMSNTEFSNNGIAGEIDLAGANLAKRVIYICEVKETNSPKTSTKAYHQLEKDEAYIKKLFKDFEPFRIVRLYAYSNKNKRQKYEVVNF